MVAFFLFNYSQNIFIAGAKHLKNQVGRPKIIRVMKEEDFEDFKNYVMPLSKKNLPDLLVFVRRIEFINNLIIQACYLLIELLFLLIFLLLAFLLQALLPALLLHPAINTDVLFYLYKPVANRHDPI